MNPSFTAMQKAWMTTMSNMMFGIEHKPKEKGTQETSINGRAFAPGKGVQQLESSEEKEANVRAHLDKLASEAKARYLDECSKYPTLKADVEKGKHDFPRSDMVVLMEEEQARRARITFNTKANAKVMTALYGSDNDAAIDITSTHEQVLKALHDTHAAYIDRQILLNRTTYIDSGIEVVEDAEPKYPTSDLIDLLHEHIAEIAERTEDEIAFEREQADENNAHVPIIDRVELQARREAAANACIHTGEGMNIENHNANKGVPWHQQG